MSVHRPTDSGGGLQKPGRKAAEKHEVTSAAPAALRVRVCKAALTGRSPLGGTADAVCLRKQVVPEEPVLLRLPQRMSRLRLVLAGGIADGESRRENPAYIKPLVNILPDRRSLSHALVSGEVYQGEFAEVQLCNWRHLERALLGCEEETLKSPSLPGDHQDSF